MENKEDLGKLIKNQLENLKKSPDDDLWDKINTTLDNRDRRKKRFFLLVISSLLIVLSILIFKPLDLFTNDLNLESQNENNTLNFTEDSNSSYKITNTKTTKQSITYPKGKLDFLFPLTKNDSRNFSIENLYSKEKYFFNFRENPVGKNDIKNNELSHSKKALTNKPKQTLKSSETVVSSKNKNDNPISEIAFNEKNQSQNDKKNSDESEEESIESLNDSLKKPAEKDAIKIPKKEQVNRWSISIASGVLLYTPLNKGSLINTRLDSNSKSGNITFSYGVSLNYYVNENLTLGIGANKNRMSYTTANIPSSNEVEINWILNHSTLDAIPNLNIAQLTDFIGEDAEINLVHQINYVELPLHITYRFTNNKFGFLINGGMSMSFVNNNKLFAQNSNKELLNLGNIITVVNRNVNLNFGTGVFYNLTDKFSIELSPYFKYSLRKYNLNEGRDKPHLLGVNSVLIYKFW